MTNNKKGFTLIELLVVIAIIGILSAIGLVSLNGAREKARDAKRQSDLAQIRSAMALYYDDQNPATYFPAATAIDASIAGAGGAGSFKVAMAPYLPNLPQYPSTPGAGDNGYWYISASFGTPATSHFAVASKMEGALKDWYVLNDLGYGGTLVSATNRALGNAALTCTGTDAGAAAFEVCITTPA